MVKAIALSTVSIALAAALGPVALVLVGVIVTIVCSVWGWSRIAAH